MDEVLLDFSLYSTEGLIEPAQLIKVAQRVSYDLGLRIHTTKNAVLEISNKKARLPDDFYVLDYAILCTKTYKYKLGMPSGTHREDIKIECSSCDPCPPTEDHSADPCYVPPQNNCCMCDKTYTNECGETFMVVQKKGFDVTVFEEFEQIRFKMGSKVNKNCCLPGIPDKRVGEIKNNHIYTNLDNGNIFIVYQGALEDDEGNLLVLDHPLANEYYEYALKQRILENLYMNGEDVFQKLQLMEPRLRAARNNALTVVNTPDFKEMCDIWETNRKAMYRKYYSIFK